MVLEIFIEMHHKELRVPLTILNLYGPYLGREHFWNDLFPLSVLISHNLIIGGYLNLNLSCHDIWGACPREYMLANFFVENFEYAYMSMSNLIQLGKTTEKGIKIFPKGWTNYLCINLWSLCWTSSRHG